MEPTKQKSMILPLATTALVCIVVFTAAGYYLGVNRSSLTQNSAPTPTPITSATATISPTTSPSSTTKDETASWKTYTDSKTGFTFKYPETAELKSSPPYDISSQAPTGVFVKVYNLKTMEDEPLGYDKATLTALRDDLKSGKVKTFVSGLYAKETLTLRQIEVCDVQFTRKLDVFDGKDILVSLTYFIPDSQESTLVKNNPNYFTTDSKNCGSEKVWKDTGEESFRTDLAAKKTDSLSQKWYQDFAQIASSFKFTK